MEWETVLINLRLVNFFRHLLPGLFCLAALSAAAGPTQYPSVLAAFEDMGDYTPEENTLAIESAKPLRIRVSPTQVSGDAPEHVAEDVRRAAVYAVLRVFLHTRENRVHVTSVPRLLNIKSGESKILAFPRATIDVDRATVEKVVRSELGLKNLADLVEDSLLPDMWSKTAELSMYGKPGAAIFAKRLGVAIKTKPLEVSR